MKLKTTLFALLTLTILWPTEHSITVYMNSDILTLSFSGSNDDNAERMPKMTD